MNNNSIIITNVVRFFALVLIQILILKQVVIAEGFWNSFRFIIYPLFILLLPFNINRLLLIFLGFLIGLTVDIFYDTPGVHASASTLIAFLRGRVLKILEPKGGYNVNFSPTRNRMGNSWFVPYVSILLFIHLLTYFSMEAFTLVYFVQILQNTFFSFFASFSIIMIFQIIFNPLN
ncbi:MAG: rod shape-determining protein MreD [Bacteroidota bacterium]